MRVCTKCGKKQEPDQFYDDKRLASGKKSRCKTCTKTYNHDLNASYAEARKARKDEEKTRELPWKQDLQGLSFFQIKLLTFMRRREMFTTAELAICMDSSYVSTMQVLKRLAEKGIVNRWKVSIPTYPYFFWCHSIGDCAIEKLDKIKSKVMIKHSCNPTPQPRTDKCQYHEDCADYVFSMKWLNWSCENCPVYDNIKDCRAEWSHERSICDEE